MSEVISLNQHRRGPAAPRVIALGGGKGGAGRTVLTANVGIFLAQLGKKVIVVDASLGGANLHTLLAVEAPPLGIADFLSGRVTQIEDVLTPVDAFGLYLCGGAAATPPVLPKREAIVRLVERLASLDVDYVLLDLDAGAAPHTLDLFLSAHLRVSVLAPELTAIERNYHFLESCFYREIFGPTAGNEEALLSRRVLERTQQGGARSSLPLLLAELESGDAPAAAFMRKKLARFRPYVLVNQARTTSDSRLLEGIRSVSRRRFGMGVEPLGPVEIDDAVWLSVRRRRPLVLEYPDSAATRVVVAIARKLVTAPASQIAAPVLAAGVP